MDLTELKNQMETKRGAESTVPIPFRIERSELNAQLAFAEPLWPIANNVAALYSGLLAHMGEFGVTSHAMRADNGDGSLGGFNINFWMLQYGAIVRIRLDGIEVNVPNFSVDVGQLERALLALDLSLREAQNNLSYSNFTLTVGMHGRAEGVDSKQFLERFTGKAPQGLGSLVGSGAIFYFEGPPPITVLSVSADLSATVAGGIFVKVHSVFDGSMKMDALRRVAEPQLEQSIKALGLDVSSK